jgi:hypothetical protein
MSDWRGTFPDLPILEEVGAQLETAAHQQPEDSAVEGGLRSRLRQIASRARQWPRVRMRPALLALAVVAITVALVVTALGISSRPDRPSPAPEGDARAVAQGSGPDDAWTLTLARTPRGRCLQLDVAGAPPSRATCIDDAQAGMDRRPPGAPPVAGSRAPVDFTVTNGPRDGFVFGTVPATVSTVRVIVGGREVTADARPLGGPFAGERLKAFVAELDQPVDPAEPIRAVTLDERGRVIGSVSRPAGG